MSCLWDRSTPFIGIKQNKEIIFVIKTEITFLKLISTERGFLGRITIETVFLLHLADFPPGLLNQALTGTLLPRGDLTAANPVVVVSSSNSSNFEEIQWQQQLGQGSGATQ